MASPASRGQATLSLVLLIGGIASAVVIAISLIAISAIGTGFGADQLQRSRAAALAGIEDGALRLARNAADSGTYTINPGITTTTVTIYQATPSAGYVTVFSQATAGVRRVRFYGVYTIDANTGIPTLVSLDTN